MTAPLENPSVLITSGTQRLGLACAKEALELGFDVILHYRSRRSEADAWLRRHREFGRRVAFVQRDLRPENAAELVDDTRRLCRTLAGLVNNASVFTPGALSDTPHLIETLRTNALVPAVLVSAYARVARAGWVVNITDANISQVNFTYQNYRISKLLLTELTRQQAALFAPNVRVNAIAPGAILPAAGASPAAFAKLGRGVPLRTTGTLADIRQAFAYLVRGAFVTGVVLDVDGGQHLGTRAAP